MIFLKGCACHQHVSFQALTIRNSNSEYLIQVHFRNWQNLKISKDKIVLLVDFRLNTRMHHKCLNTCIKEEIFLAPGLFNGGI